MVQTGSSPDFFSFIQPSPLGYRVARVRSASSSSKRARPLRSTEALVFWHNANQRWFCGGLTPINKASASICKRSRGHGLDLRTSSRAESAQI